MARMMASRLLSLVLAGLASMTLLSGCSRVDDLEAQIEEMYQEGSQLVERLDAANKELEDARDEIAAHEERMRSIRIELSVAEVILERARTNASLMPGGEAFSVYLEIGGALDSVRNALEEVE